MDSIVIVHRCHDSWGKCQYRCICHILYNALR